MLAQISLILIFLSVDTKNREYMKEVGNIENVRLKMENLIEDIFK